jgi:hypothetical protein
MTKEIALRLKPIFKYDFKRARYQASCINPYPNLNSFKNKGEERRFDRKVILFEITKELYIECLNILNPLTNDKRNNHKYQKR